MGSPKLQSWNNVPFKTWEYQDQTEMKHKVFSYYLPLWLQILGTFSNKLNYIDGFGGIGAYHSSLDKNGTYLSNQFGSPIRTLETINSLQAENRIGNVNVMIIDQDNDNLNNIKKIINYKGINTYGELLLVNGSFDKEINEFLDTCKNIAPTFFLIDPFGFKDIKMSTIKRIMSNNKTEILLNFMYSSIHRWTEHPDEKILKHFDEYFGTTEWRDLCGQNEKEIQMINLFRQQCKHFCLNKLIIKMKYPDQDKTIYYLFHLSNHWLGCSRMKDSFGRFNNGKTEYTGNNGTQMGLFSPSPESIDKDLLIRIFTEIFSNSTYTYEQVLSKIIDETDFTEKEIKIILNELENSMIKIVPHNGRKRRSGIKYQDVISFK